MMQVTKAVYTSPDNNSVEVTFDDGTVITVPDPLPANIKPTLAINTYSTWRNSNTPSAYVHDYKAEALAKLQASDAQMARIGEDLISLLVSKGTISMDELPQAAQDKIEARKRWRAYATGSSSSSASE